MNIIVEQVKVNRESQIIRITEYYRRLCELKSRSFENSDVEKKSKQEEKSVWGKIVQVFEKEAKYEKKLYHMLNEAAENHPLIAKVIVVILTCILAGLIEDCIHDAIQMRFR